MRIGLCRLLGLIACPSADASISLLTTCGLPPALQYVRIPSGNCQHGPGAPAPTTDAGPQAVGCEPMAGTNWIQTTLPVDNVPQDVVINGVTYNQPLRSQARSLRT